MPALQDNNGRPLHSETARQVRTSQPSSPARRRLSDGRLALLRIARKTKPPNHHFFPGLITPTYFLSRIRIEFVPGGVVKVGHAIQPCSLWKRYRFFQHICQLPVEVVLWHLKKDL